MSPLRRAIPVVVAFAVVVGLAGCAPAVPTPTDSPDSTSAPTATPTAVAVAPPVNRLGLSCEDVAPVAQVDSTEGLPLVLGSGLWEVQDLEPYSYLQDGGLQCSYTLPGPSAPLGFYDIDVIPDVTPAEFATVASQYISDTQFNSSPEPFGPNTYLECSGDYHNASCFLNALIGTTYVYIGNYTDKQPTESHAAAQAHFLPLLTHAVDLIKSATTKEPAWSDPSATAVAWPSTEAAMMTAISTAVGFSVTPSISGPDQTPDPGQPESQAEIPTKYMGYVGDSDNYEFSVEVLPAGAWAWAQVVSSVSSKPAYTVQSGIGDQAISYNSSNPDIPIPYETIIEATKGHNLISVELYTSSASKAPGMLAVAQKTAAVVLGYIS